MKKKQIAEAFVLCVLLLLLGAYAEHTGGVLDDENRIIRGSPDERTQTVELTLDAQGVADNYSYKVTVTPEQADETLAQEYFAQAKAEIDAGFYADGETADHVTQSVQMDDSYADGVVEAEWTLDSYRIVDAAGEIRTQELSEDGETVQATALLSCGAYKEEYTFSFLVFPKTLSAQEALLQEIDESIAAQNTEEGSAYLTLPSEAEGVTLHWSEKKEHLVAKILFFEVVVLVLLGLASAERRKTARKERLGQMALDYAEVVSKLLLLLGSGMSLKQAWNKISAQYSAKREKKEVKERFIYEEMLITNRAIIDGESERRAYQNFGERVELGSYQRLIRILLQNMQTGSRGLCALLAQESETALEERRAAARTLGEEAGTKMLLPLMLMLGIVIAIIMVPAILSFQV